MAAKIDHVVQSRGVAAELLVVSWYGRKTTRKPMITRKRYVLGFRPLAPSSRGSGTGPSSWKCAAR